MTTLVQHEPLINSQHIGFMRFPSIRLIGVAGWINVLLGLVGLIGTLAAILSGKGFEAMPLALLTFFALLFGLVTQSESKGHSKLSSNKSVYVGGCLFNILLAVLVDSGPGNTPFCLMFICIAIVYGLHASRLPTGPNLSHKRTLPRRGWSAYFRR
jgi:hypothetical protein